MSITKILPLIIVTFFLASCDKNGKAVKSIIDFTPKLQQEQADFKTETPIARKVQSWPGVNFVNETGSNFEIADLSLKFKGSSIKTTGKIIAAPVIKDNKIFLLDSKSNVFCYDLDGKKPNWVVNLSSDTSTTSISSGGITLDGDRLYVVNNSRSVVILETATGYEISRLKLNDVIISPVTVDAENLYVLMADNQMI